MVRATSPMLMFAVLLAACGNEQVPASSERRDPAIAQALDDPLMTDPDLSSRNEGAAALTVVTDEALPVLPARTESVAAARAEAAAMIGDADQLAPVPGAAGTIAPLASSHTPADHLAVLKNTTACRARLDSSAAWAARLPAALPVYPRGATQSATGGDGKGCRVIAVVFTTAVPVDDVLAFYWHRARAAGLAPVRRQAGEWSVLQGQRAGAAFDLRVAQTDGLTIAELATVTG